MVYSIRNNKPFITTKPLEAKAKETERFDLIKEILELNDIEFEKTEDGESKVILKEKN